MGASQSSTQIQSSSRRFQKGGENRIPELLVSVETWTRESHGLYDFEGTEIQKISLKLKGSHRISRDDSKVSAEKVSEDRTFEECEKALNNEDRDKVIARLLYRDNSYWIYHKNLIDENAEAVLERKPEEKIWQVVKQIRQPEFEFPCYKMRKNDLVKVGRVRFKIRDMMSPVYREINEVEDLQQRQFRRVYPSYEPSSVQESINITDQSQHQDQAFQNQVQPSSEDTDSEVDLGIELGQNEDQPGVAQQNSADINIDSLMNGTGNALIMQRAITKAPSFKKKKDKSDLLPKIDEARKSCKSESPACRICLAEEEETSNPLISPCKCAGSMRFIHHLCLKTWFQNKRVVKSSNIVTTYFWKNLECELCKQSYPYETRTLDGREMLNIIEYTVPNNSSHYIVLESISSNTSKVIHVVNMQNTVKLYIGRGHDAHVRVTDISVSRLHAVIIKSTLGYYYLSDNDSKFGTLALVRSPLLMMPEMRTQLQIGRSLLTVEIKSSIQNIIMQCLCVSQKQGQQKGSAAEADLISLDGINYFPKEFANEAYLKLMANRQIKQMRSLKRKESIQHHNQHHQTTQQNNESAALEEQVDQFINDQNEVSQALLSADERQVQNQVSSSSDEQANDFEEALFQSQRSPLENYQQLSRNESDSSESVDEGLDDDERLAQAQDLDLLEQAIQESLALHHQQQQLSESRTVNQSILEEQKIEEEKSQIQVDPNEESKIQQADYMQIEANEFGGKRQPVLQQEEQMSNISTSRQSQHPLNDLRSSLVLAKHTRPLLDNDYRDEAGDRTILHDMPTQLVPKAKANFLVNPEKLKTQRAAEQANLTQNINHKKSLETDNKNAPKTSRNAVNIDIASQVIIEQGEELAEDNGRVEQQRTEELQTIENKLPQSATDVQPPNLS